MDLFFTVKIGFVYYFYLASAVWSLFVYCLLPIMCVCVCVLHVLFIFAAGHTNMFSVYIVNFSYKNLYVDIIHCQVGSSSWLILKVHLRIMQVCWKCFC